MMTSTMVKAGRTELKERKIIKLKEAITGARTKSSNTCDELEFLKDRYKDLQYRIKDVIRAVKTYHTSMTMYAETQVDVAEAIAELAESSPLEQYTGHLVPNDSKASKRDDKNVDANKGGNGEERQEPEISMESYWYYHDDAANRMAAYADKYEEYIVNYAIEWERKVQDTVLPGIEEAEKLRRNVDHYENKVRNIRHKQASAKGRTIDQKAIEKLERNEEKYHIVQEKYTHFVADMCILLEELTDKAWKDLHPLLMKLVQFDKTTSNDRAKALGDLKDMADVLEQMGDGNGGFRADALLKDIEEELHFNKKYTGESAGEAEDTYDYDSNDEEYDERNIEENDEEEGKHQR